jgi:hypothetical protein
VPTPPLNKQEWTRRKAVIEDALRKGHPPPGTAGSHIRGAIAIAAEALGIGPASLQNSIHRAKILKFSPPKWSLYKASEAAKIEQQTPDTVRTRNQVADLQKRLTDALEYASKLEDIRKSVFNLQPENVTVPTWQVNLRAGKSQPEIPTLLTSDFQAGEVIRSAELDFPNDYSPAIFRERYRRLIQTSVKLLERENPKMDYPGMIYLRAGDAVSGSIHLDLEATDEGVPTEQTLMVVEEEIRGIEELLKAVPKVTVYSVPGNHDRTTFKPRAKRFVALSYDYLAIWAIQSYFKAKGEDRVTFCAPASGDALYKVFDTNYLLTHGDRIGARGGTGFIGPAATVSKGAFKLRAQYAQMQKRVDYVLMGHFHTPMQLPNAIVNGSLAGFNEYARSELRCEPGPPVQTMFWTHAKWGLTTLRRIRVDHD